MWSHLELLPVLLGLRDAPGPRHMPGRALWHRWLAPFLASVDIRYVWPSMLIGIFSPFSNR